MTEEPIAQLLCSQKEYSWVFRIEDERIDKLGVLSQGKSFNHDHEGPYQTTLFYIVYLFLAIECGGLMSWASGMKALSPTHKATKCSQY